MEYDGVSYWHTLIGISVSRFEDARKISNEVLWNSCSGKDVNKFPDTSTNFKPLWLLNNDEGNIDK